MMTFKIGDKIKCIDNAGFEDQITLGRSYMVSHLWSSADGVYITNDLNNEIGFLSYRFELEETPSPSGWSTDGNPLLTILEETTAKARQLIIEKGGEYAADTDVLANFRHEAGKLGLPMEVIWHIYIGKHLSAIDRYVRDIKDGKTDRPRMETLESRADDIITYMIHFKMMLKERQNV